MEYVTIRVTKEVHKELKKAVGKRKKNLSRNVTASELIGDMIRSGAWNK